jgi:transposase
MITMEVFMDILALHRQGCTLREISRKLGIHRNTVNKYINGGKTPQYQKEKRKKSILDPFKQMISDWLEMDNYRASWVYQQIKDLGFGGCYDTVKGYVRTVKASKRRQAFIRFETIPGLQGQVDWADFKISVGGGADITLYLFVMVLGFSRAMYAELVPRCSLQAFMEAHLRAFRYLGGVPAELLYDNMRHVFMGRQNGHKVINVELVHFANHCIFKPILCPPYSPWIKGKVERPIDYIREGFWRGYAFADIASGNQDLLHWLSHTANRRIHGTHRQPVDMRWQQEAKRLNPVPADYDTAIKVYRTVYKDCMVSYNTNHYHVPPQVIGKKVLLKIKDGAIRIFDDERLLISHAESSDRHRWVIDPGIIEQILAQRHAQLPQKPYVHAKGKATRGLVDASLFTQVEHRPLSVYDRFAQGGAAWTN